MMVTAILDRVSPCSKQFTIKPQYPSEKVGIKMSNFICFPASALRGYAALVNGFIVYTPCMEVCLSFLMGMRSSFDYLVGLSCVFQSTERRSA